MRFLKNKKNKDGPRTRSVLARVSPRWRGGEKGQTLVEMVFALGVAVLVIVALVVATTVAVRNAQFAKSESLASKYAQDGMEKIRAYRDQNAWETFKNGCSSYNPGPVPTPFTLTVNCVQEAANKLKVTITVSWSDAKGTHSSKQISYFTNWQ